MTLPEQIQIRCGVCQTDRWVPNPDWLRARRLQSGQSLRAWAKRLAVSAPYVSDIERGRRTCPSWIARRYEML